MANVSLLLQICTIYTVLRLSLESCFPFLNGNIGHLVPEDFQYVEEGTILHLECTLDPVFAANNSLAADDIFWENPTYERLSSEVDKRVSLAALTNHTAILNISNVTVLDDGNYRCSVMLNGINRRICSIEVPIAGPPKKYLDFSCESQNFLNLICKWKKSGYYTGRSQMKYTLKYRTEAGPDEYDCPRLTSDRSGWYKCEWNSTAMKNPPIMLQYTHLLTINGTNSFGSDVWTETVTPHLLVRPAPPQNITTSNSDDNSCFVKWSVVSNLEGDFVRRVGLLAQIDVAKSGSPNDPAWTTMAADIEEMQYNIENLDAYANYSIRVRVRPKDSGFWSDFGMIACTTKPAIPSGSLGIVPGAYEEVGNGGQRRVTLYWQGIPEHLRNGPDFRYKVISRAGSEMRDLGETSYANYFIVAPANSSFHVDVIPVNQQGEGKKETAVIPAVKDSPLLIEGAHVVRFASDSRYELSWTSNKPADVFDLFWCPTSLKPHLAKCTDQMSHAKVGGDLQAYNLTLNSDHEYRFAVSGRVGDLWSGMNWIARACYSTDKFARLEGLTATALVNASVELTWDLPCQHRFLSITGYRVYFYHCDINTPKECSPDNYIDVLKSTQLVIRDLRPGERYCFLLMVLDDVNSTSPYVHKVEQCITTTQLTPFLPMTSIVSGSVAGAIFLVIFAFILWRLIKRMRNDFKEIQKQSRVINMPPALFDKYDDGYCLDRTHYTRVDSDGHIGGGLAKSFIRQLSSVSETSTSGHGSVTSEGTNQSSRISGSDDTDGQYLTKRVDMISALTGPRLAVSPHSQRVKHRHSTFDLDHLSRNLHKPRTTHLPDSISLHSSDSSLSAKDGVTNTTEKTKPRLRIRVPSNVMTMAVAAPPPGQPARKVSLVRSQAVTTDSGLSDSQASSGYVVAVNVASLVLTPQVSVGPTDNGYVSQQSTMSHSLNGSEVSVFSDLDSPNSPLRTETRKGQMAPRLSLSFPESEEDGRATNDFGGSDTNLHQTSIGKPPHILTEKAIPIQSGYVAWP